MNPTGLIDLLGGLCILAALTALVRGWKRGLPRDTKVILVGLLLVTLFHDLSNTLQWTGVSPALDPYEDYLELLIPIAWFFLFYSFLRQETTRELQEAHGIISRSPAVAFLWKNEEGWPVEYVSENIEELFGYTTEDLMSGKIAYAATVHPDDLARVAGEVAAHSEGTDSTAFSHAPYRIITKLGETKWVDDRTVINRDNEGRITHYQGIILDITDRMRAQSETKRKVAELTAINKIGLAVGANIGLDAVLMTIYRQVSALMDASDFRIRLYDPEEETLRSVFKMRSGQRQEMGREGPFGQGRSEHVIRTGKPLLLRNMTSEKYRELGIITHSPLPAYVGVPLIASGRIIGVLAVRNWEQGDAFDETHLGVLTAVASQAAASIENARLYEQAQEEIANRKEAAAILRESENRYRELFEGSPVPLWEQDFDNVRKFLSELRQSGVNDLEEHFTAHPDQLVKCADLIAVTDVNRATVSLFRAASKASLMESVGKVFVEESVPVFLRSLLSIDAGSGSFESDLVLQALDGERLIVAFQWTEVRGRVLASTQDITDRIRAEEEKLTMEAQLRQGQKLEAIGTLASGVAHEVNNPLTGIVNYADLIADRVQDDQLREFAVGIMEEGRRVAAIVRNLLTFSRQDKEEHSLARMEDIVDASLMLIESVLQKDQITVKKEIAEGLPSIRCRSQQIEQVLINLLTNARDSLNERYPTYDDDKVVRIEVKPIERGGIRWIRTTIEDRGLGIPEGLIERIFDPFYTTKPRDKGTGLGLSVSYGIVKDHHGDLTVESEEGAVTRLHMDLPVDNGWTL